MHPSLVIIHLSGRVLWFCDLLSRQYDNVTVERTDTNISKDQANLIPSLKEIKPGSVLSSRDLLDLFAAMYGPELQDSSNSD